MTLTESQRTALIDAYLKAKFCKREIEKSFQELRKKYIYHDGYLEGIITVLENYNLDHPTDTDLHYLESPTAIFEEGANDGSKYARKLAKQ